MNASISFIVIKQMNGGFDMKRKNTNKFFASLICLLLIVTMLLSACGVKDVSPTAGIPAGFVSETEDVVTTEENTSAPTGESTETQGKEGVCSDASYGGFDLTWTNCAKYIYPYDILLSASNEDGVISFQYDERICRTSKTNAEGEVTYFTYDENRNLTMVQYGEHRLEYSWDALDNLRTITIDGLMYTCELDDGSVIRLYDTAGNIAVEYHYTDDCFVDSVYGRNEAGELVDKTNDRDFIGNINKVTYNSYYFDEETGWYYCGRYYDPANRRFVEGISGYLVDEMLNELFGW